MSKYFVQSCGIILFLFTIVVPSAVFAQESTTQVMSVTPPLFQISVAPGDLWQSTIRVVNGNAYELPVYAERVNFASVGESGQGRFIPLFTDDTNSTLASWINIASGPFVVPPGQSMDIPFFIEVPDDAPPGGHFAAVLIGTQPPKTEGERYVVQTSQAVTSLFFLRIAGDVIEEGSIREFSVEDTFVEEPEASFVLRFENKGNVHLQPKGDIIITNMWGKERGVIPINQQSFFGNVLPQSIREYNLKWRGEGSITDIGRYKAIVTLAYGEDGIKSDFRTTYFWVIPIKATLITLGSIAAFIFFIIWAIRRYIRRTLLLAGVDVDQFEEQEAAVPEKSTYTHEQLYRKREDINLTSIENISAPIRSGARDLRSRLREVTEFFDVIRTIIEFVINYKLFFITVLVLVAGFVGIVLYISDAAKEQRSYEVVIEENGVPTVVDSEEIIKDRLADDDDTEPRHTDEQMFMITVVNASGQPGKAAETAIILENAGFVVAGLSTDASEVEATTRLVYDESLEDEAEKISETIGGSVELVTEPAGEDTGSLPKMELRIGSDRAN